jgi:hypothetical protein
MSFLRKSSKNHVKPVDFLCLSPKNDREKKNLTIYSACFPSLLADTDSLSTVEKGGERSR